MLVAAEINRELDEIYHILCIICERKWLFTIFTHTQSPLFLGKHFASHDVEASRPNLCQLRKKTPSVTLAFSRNIVIKKTMRKHTVWVN